MTAARPPYQLELALPIPDRGEAPRRDAQEVETITATGVLKARWSEIEDQLLQERYQPQPVRRVKIPKPAGGTRNLGIPTVIDRVIQQAVLERLQPQWDRTFSEHSYGFRPGRSAHHAVAQAQTYVIEGCRFVVDIPAGCPSCSAIADGFNGFAVHLANHDVMLWAVSHAPLTKLQAYKRRMGWTFPWASSLGTDFNFDFDVSITEEQQREGAANYNYQRAAASESRGGTRPQTRPRATPDGAAKGAAMTGTDVRTYAGFRAPMPESAFATAGRLVPTRL